MVKQSEVNKIQFLHNDVFIVSRIYVIAVTFFVGQAISIIAQVWEQQYYLIFLLHLWIMLCLSQMVMYDMITTVRPDLVSHPRLQDPLCTEVCNGPCSHGDISFTR